MSEQELARDLGFLEAYTLGLGTMIGAGIFVLPGIVAEAAGPASMVSFTIGGIVALLAALSLSELATGMPRAGGSYYYINHALGSFFGTIVGWGMWAGLMFATAFYMLGFGQYLLDQPSTAIGVVVAAVVMAALLTLLNYRGVKETGSFQNYIVIALVGLILVFILIGLPQIDTGLLQPFTAGQGWAAVGVTAGTVFVTFIGFEVIATSAEEIKNPGRNLPLAMVAAVVTPTLLYVLVMLVSTGVLPVPELATSDVPVADVARATAGALGAVTVAGFTVQFSVIGGVVMIIGAVLATISSANASILSAARVNFAMGRDKILAEWLNQIHGKYRTPYRAILATGGVILLLIASPLPIATLADVAAFMFLVTYALVHIAVIVLRRAEPEDYEPDFRIPSWGYPAIPIVGFLGCVAVLVQMGDTSLIEVSGVTLLSVVQAIGLGIILLSIGWWAYYSREKAISTALVGEAVAPSEPETPEDDVYRVVVPIANPATEQALMGYAAASAYGHEGKAELVAVNVIEVPPQMSPEQIELEEERVERQQELLDSARGTAETLDIPLRTRAMVGRNAGRALLSVVEEEEADHVLMGWSGQRRRRDAIFGSTLDPVIERATCEVTLVTNPSRAPGRIVALAGRGPNAPSAVRRAGELTRTFADASLTLLNVQPPAEEEGAESEETDDETPSPTAVGEDAITSVATAAGLDASKYESRVVVSDAVRESLLETVHEYDTVSVGATGQNFAARALYGSIPQAIVEQSDETVLIARDADQSPRTVRDALRDRLQRLLEEE